MENTPAFCPYPKCAGMLAKPRAYWPDGKGRDYYITHDLYDQGNQYLNRPNSYSCKKNFSNYLGRLTA